MTPIDTALRDAMLEIDEIEQVILVGGSSRILKIVEMIQQKFQDPHKVCSQLHKDEAIAMGAAVQAALLYAQQLVAGAVLPGT